MKYFNYFLMILKCCRKKTHSFLLDASGCFPIESHNILNNPLYETERNSVSMSLSMSCLIVINIYSYDIFSSLST